MLGKYLATAITTLAAVSVCAGSVITDYTYTPSPDDLNDLPHGRVYMWGVDTGIDPSEEVIAATLTFTDVRNNNLEPNWLYTHLLDSCAPGVTEEIDNQDTNNYFVGIYSGIQTHLITYTDLPTTPQTLEYNFNTDQLMALNSYLADGNIGIGVDPDCHFYNTGVELKLTTPEPTSVGLIGLGVMSLIWRRR